MKTQLLENGLADSVLDVGDGRQVSGAEMVQLCQILVATEEAISALERRGVSLRVHAERMDVETGRLPVYHVFLGSTDYWFTSRKQIDEFLQQQEQAAGQELSVSDIPEPGSNGNGEAANTIASKLHITELHEVRTINTQLGDLVKMRFDIQTLIPQERTGVEEARYTLRRGDAEIGLDDLRGLLPAVRAAGEKGLNITRFKGLGEMNAEELRGTTLDPEDRTLGQVSMRDVGAADEMFRVLMGDKVEPRREFIEKHALDVRNLDV